MTVREVAVRARPVPELLQELLKRGNAATAAELSAEAMKRGLELLENSDDSDGVLSDILSAVARVHVAAARKGGIPKLQLAKNLFELELTDGFGFFALEDYLSALGKDGLAAYRGLAAAAWKEVSLRGPGDNDHDNDGQRYALTNIMKTLARIDGDINALVDVLRRDLSASYTWLEIAEVLSKARRHDEALQWAEKAGNIFAAQSNPRLDDFIVAEYHRRKRYDDAVALRWGRFTESPGLQTYQDLASAASQAKTWTQWREKALAVLESPKVRNGRSRHGPSWVDWVVRRWYRSICGRAIRELHWRRRARLIVGCIPGWRSPVRSKRTVPPTRPWSIASRSMRSYSRPITMRTTAQSSWRAASGTL
jgi:tetratricopeptide (TPR) repeat protein